jgi:signal transduction histidine kinase
LRFQVIQNFLQNSIKFSYQNDTIKISLFSQDGHAVIQISDNGIGMPAAIINNVFTMHKKTSSVGTEGERGTGYGMPIAYEFIKAMGGTVEIKSLEENEINLAHGTEFKIKFKLPV